MIQSFRFFFHVIFINWLFHLNIGIIRIIVSLARQRNKRQIHIIKFIKIKIVFLTHYIDRSFIYKSALESECLASLVVYLYFWDVLLVVTLIIHLIFINVVITILILKLLDRRIVRIYKLVILIV